MKEYVALWQVGDVTRGEIIMLSDEDAAWLLKIGAIKPFGGPDKAREPKKPEPEIQMIEEEVPEIEEEVPEIKEESAEMEWGRRRRMNPKPMKMPRFRRSTRWTPLAKRSLNRK